MVEQRTFNPWVLGSSPRRPTCTDLRIRRQHAAWPVITAAEWEQQGNIRPSHRSFLPFITCASAAGMRPAGRPRRVLLQLDPVSQFPRIVLSGLNVPWPSASYPICKSGTIVDIKPGSALETAYGGASNLAALSPVSRDEIQDKSALAN
jgi:hypothetical protein